jgi:hypothetical protein
MGLSLASDVGGYFQAASSAKLQERMQQYRNTMSELSAARSMNAISINEARLQDTAIEQDQLIQRAGIADQGAAAVAAAAAGVKGNSVDMVMHDLRGSAGRATYAANRSVVQQRSEMSEQRTSVAIGAIMNRDVSVIQKPSIGMSLLGAGTNLLKIYDSHQPAGDKIL